MVVARQEAMILNWYVLAWSRALNFGGRSTRREFWSWLGINVALYVILFSLDRMAGLLDPKAPFLLSQVFAIVIAIPMVSVLVRRLHDMNVRAWWLLVPLSIGIGLLVASRTGDGDNVIRMQVLSMLYALALGSLVLLSLPGKKGPNRFGVDPRETWARDALITWARSCRVRPVIAIAMGVVALTLCASRVAESQTERGRVFFQHLRTRVRGGFTVEERLQCFGRFTGSIPKPFRTPSYVETEGEKPPDRGPLSIVVFKDERRLMVFEKDPMGSGVEMLVEYPVLGLSGRLGPKLKEGDLQVPEGIYEIEWLNPNSRYHVSMRLNYPNAFDQEKAKLDGRTKLGGDIMIHGSNGSAGCLAMGDEAIERIFLLVGRNHGRCRVIVAPTDLRVNAPPNNPGLPPWAPELYNNLRAALQAYPPK